MSGAGQGLSNLRAIDDAGWLTLANPSTSRRWKFASGTELVGCSMVQLYPAYPGASMRKKAWSIIDWVFEFVYCPEEATGVLFIEFALIHADNGSWKSLFAPARKSKLFQQFNTRCIVRSKPSHILGRRESPGPGPINRTSDSQTTCRIIPHILDSYQNWRMMK